MDTRLDPGMQTPLAELEDPAPPAAPAARRRRRAGGAPGEVRPLRAGLAHAGASWRPLLLIVGVQLLLGLTVVVPFWQGVSRRLDHHPEAAVLAGEAPDAVERAQGWEPGLDPGLWRDLKREEASLFDGLTLTHFWVVLVAWLFGALAAGGLLGTAAAGEAPVRAGRFLSEGARWYGRMLRMGLVFGLAWYLLARVVLELWGGAVGPDEAMAASEGAAWWGERVREAVLVLGFLWFRLAADLGRAELVVHGRRSALRAFLRGLRRSVRRPAWTLALAVGVPAVLVLLGLGFAAQGLQGHDGLVLLALFLVMQAGVLVRWASRAALLGGCVKLP